MTPSEFDAWAESPAGQEAIEAMCVDVWGPSNEYEGHLRLEMIGWRQKMMTTAARALLTTPVGGIRCETCGGTETIQRQPGNMNLSRKPCPDCVNGVVGAAPAVVAREQLEQAGWQYDCEGVHAWRHITEPAPKPSFAVPYWEPVYRLKDSPHG